ncbi:MAG: aspartate/tyrosine/aromatic aminotransferase [Gammaproteobacteria bacterium]|nr:aspartate/tyrosine/aromatic aminotransferase [Gammaproteobacteria bacterium]MCY4219185.1 aspartate/tyrosine/aromatic aminotransferase [Gammaproteobacteria bacterium]MCY4274423.1 aspartate/tyrosine/aromatic aminotransferase [Gammaproteobacteria bacterium]
MFQNVEPTPLDPIIRLISIFKADKRDNKIDMGVGVFRDSDGNTPIMAAVKQAEQQLHNQQTTKTYVGLSGDESFNQQITRMVFGDGENRRIRAVQAPGGCGALRVLSEMLAKVSPDSKVWLTDPTWGNHYPIFHGSRFETATYPYLNRTTKAVAVDDLLDSLSRRGPKDIVVFHGCCHNPSGAELQPEHWNEIAKLAAKTGFFPFFDLAYQGFGDSLEQDVYSIRTVAQEVESLVVASSCSKNFGLYRDRVGCAMIMGETSESADSACAQLLSTARSSYSMPPDHGAAIVGMILGDQQLRKIWEQQLSDMRARILGLRNQMSNKLRARTGHNRWDFIADHRGMFSLLVLNDEQVNRLRDDYAIYVVAGGRINIAGLRDEEEMDRFIDAFIDVTE